MTDVFTRAAKLCTKLISTIYYSFLKLVYMYYYTRWLVYIAIAWSHILHRIINFYQRALESSPPFHSERLYISQRMSHSQWRNQALESGTDHTPQTVGLQVYKVSPHATL